MYSIHEIKKIIFPFFCSYCREILSHDEILCQVCQDSIKPIVTCPLKITKEYEVKVFSVGVYQDPLRSLIRTKNYRNRKTIQDLGQLLWDMTDLKYQQFDGIVPIPLHWTRYAWRWFNQSEEIAQIVANKSNKPLVHLLKRTKKTAFQTGLSRQERSHNIKNVFCLSDNASVYRNKHILLVDDVLTTGATLKEAVQVIRKIKPASITIAVVARVV